MATQHLTTLPAIGARVARIARCGCAACAAHDGHRGTVVEHLSGETFEVLFDGTDYPMSTGIEQVSALGSDVQG